MRNARTLAACIPWQAVLLLLLLQAPQWREASCQDPASPVLTIGRSAITGLSVALGPRRVYRFLGIRYAQAPIGPRRFQPPVPEELPPLVNATRFGAQCPQYPLESVAMSEDCLFLNVFAPQLDRDMALMPVLVYIHGGGFVLGSADLFEGDVLAVEGEMVVITLNYRLGVLGFLATGDNSSRGNYGLLDQRLALQWVHKHVHHFGGDERRITLAGMSAGAASASLLSLSPVSRDLFRHVIQMSGSAISPWATTTPAAALQAARALGQRLSCPGAAQEGSTEQLVHCLRHSSLQRLALGQRLSCPGAAQEGNTEQLVHCLRHSSLQRLVDSGTALFADAVARSLLDYVWVPVRDGVLVTDMHTAAPFAGPLLAGLVNNEGGMLAGWTIPRLSPFITDAADLLSSRTFYRRQLLPFLMKQLYPDMVPRPSLSTNDHLHSHTLSTYSHPRLRHAVDVMECAYLHHRERMKVDPGEVAEVVGDQAFTIGTLAFLNTFSSSQPSFLYYFDHQVSTAPMLFPVARD